MNLSLLIIWKCDINYNGGIVHSSTMHLCRWIFYDRYLLIIIKYLYVARLRWKRFRFISRNHHRKTQRNLWDSTFADSTFIFTEDLCSVFWDMLLYDKNQIHIERGKSYKIKSCSEVLKVSIFQSECNVIFFIFYFNDISKIQWDGNEIANYQSNCNEVSIKL